MAEKKPSTAKPRKPHANKREAILQSALKTFAYYGYEGASLDKIAQDAGIVKSLVIKYYDSKENLATVATSTFLKSFVPKVASLAKTCDNYWEHTKKVHGLFRRHRKELRFVISLQTIPSQEHIATSVWGDAFGSLDQVLPFEHQAKDGLFLQLVYMMMSLHLSYIVNGNEKRFEASRQALLRQFLKPEFLPAQ